MGHNEIIRLKQLKAALGLGRSTIYTRMKSDPQFPKKICLNSSGKGAVGWDRREVDAYIEKLKHERG